MDHACHLGEGPAPLQQREQLAIPVLPRNTGAGATLTNMTLSPTPRDRFQGCLLGLAVGDAVGTTVEFQPRGSFPQLTDLVGGGPFRLKPGQWTDDTSMALCLATSLIERQGFDAEDQMRRYTQWHQRGYLSSTGDCFDIGNTVSAALGRFAATGDPYCGSTDPHSAGNGALMRLAPVPMYFARTVSEAEKNAVLSTRTTHGAEECLDASRLFARLLIRALQGAGKDDVLLADQVYGYSTPAMGAIARGEYRSKSRDDIRGSGYVVHSLEAALWSFDTTTSYRDAILTAANLGEDADTTAAICGQVAGAFFGVNGIPAEWLARLTMRSEITDLADKLYANVEESQ